MANGRKEIGKPQTRTIEARAESVLPNAGWSHLRVSVCCSKRERCTAYTYGPNSLYYVGCSRCGGG